jgi:tetratricopeptide (TPR) repeat protein
MNSWATGQSNVPRTTGGFSAIFALAGDETERCAYYLRIRPECHRGHPIQALKKSLKMYRILGPFGAIFASGLLLFAAAPVLRGDAATQPQTLQAQALQNQIAGLLDQLSSDDASQRQSAAQSLIAIGLPARPAVLQAARGDDPILRDQAAQILMQLPWYVPTDPSAVREKLLHYGAPDITDRRRTIDELAGLQTESAFLALIRLLNEDPSVDVRWTIVARLRDSDPAGMLERCRDIVPLPDDSPMLALSGYANLDIDPEKARKYLLACVDLEFAKPSDDDGEFEYVIESLSALDCADQRYDEAAQLRRKQYARGGAEDEQGVPVPLIELFVLQGNYGPLAGLPDDIKLAGPAMSGAKIQYAMSRLYERMGQPQKSAAALAAAFAASHGRQERYEVADFLADHDWDDLAAREYNALLKIPADPNEEADYLDANAHFRLAALAIKRGDDLTAAEQKEMALRFLGDQEILSRSDGHGHDVSVSVSEVWSQIHWHRLRAAEASHDPQEVAKRLDLLVSLNPTDPQIVVDAVPLLRQSGKIEQAQAMFDAAYASLKSQLDADPHNPDLLNGLAWLCAECDVRLPQALQWSQEAVGELPQNSAVMDTLAEVNFRMGRADQAVALETQALKWTPGDPFMTRQLQRFRAALQPTMQPITQPTTRPH